MTLNNLIINRLKNSLRSYHSSLENPPLVNEVDFIKRTVTAFQNLNYTAGGQTISSRSIIIHSKPIIQYYPKGPLFPHIFRRVEMGDILLVSKQVIDGVLESYRGSIIQAKFTKRMKRTWKVNSNQFFFLSEWPVFTIYRPRIKKQYFTEPNASTWSVYGFVGQRATKFPIYYSSKRMVNHLGGIPTKKSFSYSVKPNFSWDCGSSFLLRILLGYLGENLLTNIGVASFVDDLYIMMGLKPDPPEVTKWDPEKSNLREGFGIIEVTISGDQQSFQKNTHDEHDEYEEHIEKE